MLPSNEIIIKKAVQETENWKGSELQAALGCILPLLLSRNAIRLDSQIEGVGLITAYWVNDILRIDFKPI